MSWAIHRCFPGGLSFLMHLRKTRSDKFSFLGFVGAKRNDFCFFERFCMYGTPKGTTQPKIKIKQNPLASELKSVISSASQNMEGLRVVFGYQPDLFSSFGSVSYRPTITTQQKIESNKCKLASAFSSVLSRSHHNMR